MCTDHRLWDQIVKKEAIQKARFEYLTGETSAKKFFNGTNSTNVDTNMLTFDKERSMRVNRTSKGTTKPTLGTRSSQTSLQSQSKGGSRYNTKGDVLSKALEQVLSEKAKSRRSSSTIPKPYIPKPFANSTNNAKTFRDVDS